MAGAKSFEELHAWQLSVTLRDRILQEVEAGPASRDFTFRDQIRASARSAPSNIAEGFGAVMPREFARFTRIARRSLMETKNHVLDAQTQKYFSARTCQELLSLCRRAIGATTRLLAYLESCKGELPPNWGIASESATQDETAKTDEPGTEPGTEP